jgi:hypothetical protein
MTEKIEVPVSGKREWIFKPIGIRTKVLNQAIFDLESRELLDCPL